MRAFAVLLLIGGIATAGMPPPAAYECTLGSSGCVCGAGEVDVRDSADVERCTPAPSGDDEPALAAAMARSRATTYYACGDLLIDEYNRNPEAATNDRVLFDAALCYQRAHQLGGAVIALRSLTKYYPKSPLNAPALLDTARMYDAIALDDHAAEQYEAFATNAPHDPDAPAALARAIELRLGLRDLDSARRDGDRYEHAYGGSPGGEAIAFSLLPRAWGGRRDRVRRRARRVPRALRRQRAGRTRDDRERRARGDAVAARLPGRSHRRRAVHRAGTRPRQGDPARRCGGGARTADPRSRGLRRLRRGAAPRSRSPARSSTTPTSKAALAGRDGDTAEEPRSPRTAARP